MKSDASGDTGGSNRRSCSNEETRAENTKSILDKYQEMLAACALHAEAERIHMLLSYAELEKQIDSVSDVNVSDAKAAMHAAKLRVMDTSVLSTADLALKVLVAAEDNFGSNDINTLLTQDAQRIVAAAP